MGTSSIEFHAHHSWTARAVHLGARVGLRPLMTHTPLNPVSHHVLLPLIDTVARKVTPRSDRLALHKLTGSTWNAELLLPLGPHAVSADGKVQVDPRRSNRRRAIAYFHGGAFLACGLGTHRRVVEQLALTADAPVMSVNYRQYPKTTVEGSVADCVDAVRALARSLNIRVEDVVVAGDSAGGHLAVAVALAFRDEGRSVAGIATFSGWFDFDAAAHRAHRNARKDAYIPAKRLGPIGQLVLGRQATHEDSLVNRDLTGLPPALLICAAGEVLRHDTELLARRMRAAGVDATAHAYTGQVHAFPVLASMVPEARAAVRQVADFVESIYAARRTMHRHAR